MKLSPFETRDDFEATVDQVLQEIKELIKLGGKRHGDSFAETGLQGFAINIRRKGSDQYRNIVEGIDVGCPLEEINRDLITFVTLQRVYIKLLEKENSA